MDVKNDEFKFSDNEFKFSDNEFKIATTNLSLANFETFGRPYFPNSYKNSHFQKEGKYEISLV